MSTKAHGSTFDDHEDELDDPILDNDMTVLRPRESIFHLAWALFSSQVLMTSQTQTDQ